jgi:hypothetical protein
MFIAKTIVMSKTAIVLGATGATGHELLEILLADSRYEKVKLFSRTPITTIIHPKIEEHIIDMFELEKEGDAFTADELYCCIGTTKAKTPDTDTYYKIDFGIPVAAAKLAKQNNIPAFLVISAIGANKNSGVFYTRTKGEMEEAVLNLGIPKTHILQPSLIVADRKESRLVENLASGFMWLINPLLFGNAAKYKSIKATTIAKAMLWLANNPYPEKIVTSDKIEAIGKGI